jgi:tetratricopeptide (TPR) repeat protein
MKDFYISYHAVDLPYVEWITKEIELAGFTVFAQAWNQKPKATFTSEIASALQYAQNVLLILSPDYLDIPCTLDEWVNTLSIEVSDSARRILPVQVKPCVLSHLLPSREYLNLAESSDPKAKGNLIKAISYFFIEGRSNGTIEKSFLSPTFIKAMPRIWDIPFFKNPNFTGRESLLSELSGFFTTETEDDRIIAIFGPGGVGKTTLAVEYAYRYSDRYSVVFFIKAETETSIEMDLLYLARRLSLCDEKSNDIPRILSLLIGWLGTNQDWLLIFDNMEVPDLVFGFIPKNPSGDVIITTRNAFENGIYSLKVPVLNREDSRELLSILTDQTDEKILDLIADILGDLPLALEQVGAYIDQNEYTLSEYLKILQNPSHVLSDRITPTEDYPEKLTTAFELTFKKIIEKSLQAMDVLNIIAFLAPDDIPIFIFNNSKELSGINEHIDFEQIKSILTSFSVLDIQTESMSVHRLIRKFLVDRLAPDNKKLVFERAIEIIFDSFQFNLDNIDSWSVCSRLIPHIQALLEQSKAFGDGILKFADLLNKAGFYLYISCYYSLAKEFLEQAIAIKEPIVGSSHPEIADLLSTLGGVFGQMSDWKKAKEYYERVIAIDRAFYGNVHSKISRDLTCLGATLNVLDDQQAAYHCFEEALKVNKKLYESDSIHYARAMCNYGEALTWIGRLKEAMPFYKKALVIYEKTYGKNHHKVAAILQNMAGLQLDLGNIDAASGYFERAYEIDKATFSPDHRRIGDNYLNFGNIFLGEGEPEKALFYFKKALSIHRKHIGDDHIHVASILVLMGKATRDCGYLIEARAYFERAISIYKKSFSEDHRFIRRIKEDLEHINLLFEKKDLAKKVASGTTILP